MFIVLQTVMVNCTEKKYGNDNQNMIGITKNFGCVNTTICFVLVTSLQHILYRPVLVMII